MGINTSDLLLLFEVALSLHSRSESVVLIEHVLKLFSY